MTTRSPLRPAAAAAAAALLLAAAPLAAQPCAGLVFGEQRLAATLHAGLAEYATAGSRAADVGAGVHAALPFAGATGSLEAALRSPRDAPVEITVLHAALRVPLRFAALQACPLLGGGVSLGRDAATDTDYTGYAGRAGIALGIALAAAPALELAPFVTPQIVVASNGGSVLGADVDARGWSGALETGVGFRSGRLLGTLGVYVAELHGALGTGPFPNRGLTLRAGWAF